MPPVTEAMRRLGIRYPILQGPFGGGLSTVRLAATVSNRGGLGAFGAHLLAPDAITQLVGELRRQTAAPFAVNLWVSDHDPGAEAPDDALFARGLAIFRPYLDELGLAPPAPPAAYHPSFSEQAEAVLEARPPVFSFVFGVPPRALLEACRQRGIVTMGAATTLAEARLLEVAGVDLITASGAEAGGHRPAFLQPAEDHLIGSLALTRLIAAEVAVPVVAAGGIADAAGLRAALALGAQAGQLGSAFLACEESGASALHKAALFSPRAEYTVLTRSYTGRLARGIPNRLVEALTAQPAALPPFPVQAWFVGQLKAAAIAAGRADLIPLYSGQIAPRLRHRTAAALMDALIGDLAAGQAG